MKRKLLYILILFCVSLLGSQRLDIGDNSDIIETLDYLNASEYTITEYIHEQCATRPTNVQVPSMTRTTTTHRGQNSNSNTNSAYKSDINVQNYGCVLDYANSQVLISGFSDSCAYFISLCRLII